MSGREINTTRRAFLKGLLAAPAVVQFGHLMPLSFDPLPYLPGDLISFAIGTWRATDWYAICEPLLRVEGRHLIFREHQYGEYSEVRIPARLCSLSHGLPGNRVNNPSMRHRLIRQPGRIGLGYPEDEVAIYRDGKEAHNG